MTDEALVTAIQAVLAETPFHGEGYRKVRARLAHQGLAVSGQRVLRLMRQHRLLAPRRLGPPTGDPAHAGTIITSLRNKGARELFDGIRKDAARGVKVRCDWGPQYVADAWIAEVRWLGMTITPSYVVEPECNGVIERLTRTLKEQCLYLHRFQTLDESRRVIAEFIARYNHEWLIERLGHRPPALARAEALRKAAWP